MKLYIAGPMRGYEDFNFPAFDFAAKYCRKLGHTVFNPAERDREVHGPNVNKSRTGDLTDVPQFDLRAALDADLNWITFDAEGVVVLEGWEDSRGARAEVALANALDLPVIPLDDLEPAEDAYEVSQTVRLNFVDADHNPIPVVEVRETAEPVDSPRVASLKRAINYISGDRNASYGPPTQDFKRTAALWTAFGFRFVQHDDAEPKPIAAHQIANAMILLKQSRLAWQPEKPDSWDDTSGYSGCGHECVVAEANEQVDEWEKELLAKQALDALRRKLAGDDE